MQTNKVTDMSYLFQDNRALKSIDLSKFNFENVKNFERMFSTCQSLTTIDLSNLKNSKAENTVYMFFYCSQITSFNLKGFTGANLINLNLLNFCIQKTYRPYYEHFCY